MDAFLLVVKGTARPGRVAMGCSCPREQQYIKPPTEPAAVAFGPAALPLTIADLAHLANVRSRRTGRAATPLTTPEV